MKRTIYALSMATAMLLLAAIALAGCATAQATFADEPEPVDFGYVHDWSEPKVPSGAVRIVQEMEQRKAEQAAQEQETQEQAYVDYGYDESLNNNLAYLDYGRYSGDGFAQQGVREYNGRTETWYSSNQAYHYRTGEWTPDSEGYYRDSDGYYVVASEDHAEGEVFDTSKGKAKVYDSGCDSGVTDFYTNF